MDVAMPWGNLEPIYYIDGFRAFNDLIDVEKIFKILFPLKHINLNKSLSWISLNVQIMRAFASRLLISMELISF